MQQKHNVQTTCTSLGYNNISHQVSTKSTEWSLKSYVHKIGQNIDYYTVPKFKEP